MDDAGKSQLRPTLLHLPPTLEDKIRPVSHPSEGQDDHWVWSHRDGGAWHLGRPRWLCETPSWVPDLVDHPRGKSNISGEQLTAHGCSEVLPRNVDGC